MLSPWNTAALPRPASPLQSTRSRFLVSTGAAAVLLAVTPRSWGCDSCLAFSRPLSSLAHSREGAPAQLTWRHRCAATVLAPLRCRRRTAADLQAAASVAARHHVRATRGVVGAVALHAVAAASVQVAQRTRISTRRLQVERLREKCRLNWVGAEGGRRQGFHLIVGCQLNIEDAQ